MKALWQSSFFIILLSLLVTGCSREDPLYVGSDEETELSYYLEVLPSQQEINVSTSTAFEAFLVNRASGQRTDVTDSVTWSSSDDNIATVTNTGQASGIAEGNIAVSATFNDLASQANLTVSDETLIELAVFPTQQATLVGLERQFYAVARFADDRLQLVSNDVSWSSGNNAISTVSSSGLANGVTQGTTTINASLLAQNASSDIAVLNATPSEFSVSPPQSTLPVATSELFSAQLLLDSGEIIDITEQVTWSTTDASILSVSNASASKGETLALSEGSAQVIASATFAGFNLVDTATVQVTAPTLERITITPSSSTLPAGTNGTLQATAYYSDNSTLNVANLASWSSSDPNVVQVDSIAPNGGQLLALNQGNSTITAVFDSESANATVTVTPATLISLTVSPTNTTVVSGLTAQFYANGVYSDGSSHDVTAQASWLSTDTNIAIIDGSGEAHGKSVGNTTIRAIFEGMQAEGNLEVTAATLTKIEVSPLASQIQAGNSKVYKATGIFSNNSSRDLTNRAFWQSSNEDVAIPTRNGVTWGIAAGISTISATYGGLSGSSLLQVTESTLDQLIVLPDNIQLQSGTQQQYSAVGIFSDHIEDLTEQASWSSSNESIAEVSNTPLEKGRVTTLSPGTTTLTASYSGMEDSTTLTVAMPTLVDLAVTCNDLTILVDYSTRCQAIATYSDGSAQDVTEESTWTSVSPTIASVENEGTGSNAGKVTGISPGNSDISATIEGITDAITLTVEAATLVSITVNVFNTSIAVGDTEQFYATGNFNDGSTADLTLTALWESADSAILEISNQDQEKGLSTGLSPGFVTVSATQDGITGTSTTVEVIAPPIAEVRKLDILCLNGEYSGPIDIDVGETDRCKAYATRTDDTVDDVTDLATWTVDKPEFVSIEGLTPDMEYLEILGVDRGNTILRAEYGKKATMTVKVH